MNHCSACSRLYRSYGIAVVCIFWIIAIFLGTIGKIGLIRGAWQVEGGAENLIFGQLFSESTPYFWRMFGLSLIVGLPILIVVGGVGRRSCSICVYRMSQGNNASAFGFLGILPIFFRLSLSAHSGWYCH